MGKISNKLRIGEKIGLGFGFVGLLFLIVIWQYHDTLGKVLASYERLQIVYEAKETHAEAIQNALLRARRSARDFLLERDEGYVSELDGYMERIRERAGRLAAIDPSGSRMAGEIQSLSQRYQEEFLAVVDAWRIKGLDHNSGLQGAFRNSVHELEALAGHYKVGALYRQLLQIRRREKDLGLRREPEYRDHVFSLIGEFRRRVETSALAEHIKTRLIDEIGEYQTQFSAYSETALSDGDISGGKGAFRDTAHRIEGILNAHFVPDMEVRILQLRRREKDYLLRHDERYVAMALDEIEGLNQQIRSATIRAEAQEELLRLLASYHRDFLALVIQNQRIDGLVSQMNQTAGAIFSLMQQTVDEANAASSRMTQQVRDAAGEREYLMLWVAGVATVTGVLLAVLITFRITRPLLRMAGFLDRLAVEEVAERVPFTPGGRNELNSMAESVNKIAEHKKQLLEWWQASMLEVTAEKELYEERLKGRLGETADACQERVEELIMAQWERRQVAERVQEDLQRALEQMAAEVAELPDSASGREVKRHAAAIEKYAKSMLASARVVAGELVRVGKPG
jgi:methyl-accepting chemotaxis protein